MKKYILIFGLLIFAHSVFSQKKEFNPQKLKAEYFNKAKIKDKMVFTEKGKSYMVKKSKFTLGLKIKKGKNG